MKTWIFVSYRTINRRFGVHFEFVTICQREPTRSWVDIHVTEKDLRERQTRSLQARNTVNAFIFYYINLREFGEKGIFGVGKCM